ncbi:FUSC family protein [Hespellia stercorisuis]|uniref:Fusaric acid resistance protein-like n=1 Tax=Hespellia stercorisuis DSM 15480 TaxID=1121950 RepID=A0A1M6ICF8_9FIRM|nr:FUSC family protein [Hespellia stercorisuis]SHJ32087.1 Fusaric acid resistance protein-like [Hespellia stercorisuis DSM 15480]
MDSKKIKGLITELLKKLPVFLFCVLFINGYNRLCGTENSIVGVVLLMGILILVGSDLGFDARQASVSIVVLFAVLAFAPKLSLINPLLGLLINVAALTTILFLSGHDLSQSGSLPFTMGYIMLQGYDVSGLLFQKRWISLLAGGIFIAILYYMVHKGKVHKRGIKELFKENQLGSTRTQWYIRLVTTLSIVMLVGELVHFPKTMWISLTVLSLSTPLAAEYRDRMIWRVPATIIGSVVVFTAFEMFVPTQYQVMVILLAGFLSMFITSYFIKTIYNSFSALITAVLLFPADQAVGIRVVANLIGVAVATVSVVVFSKIFQNVGDVAQHY